MNTIIFSCTFYFIFSTLFIYGVCTTNETKVSMHIVYAILSLLFGWVILPIYLGKTLK